MLGFLTRPFRPPKAAPPDPRKIFQFHDGERARFIDPLPAWDAFRAELKGDLLDALKTLAAPLVPGCVGELLEAVIRRKEEVAAKVADAACVALGVEPFTDADGSPHGLTRSDRLALANDFLRFMMTLAEDARPFANSPPAV